jgi:hypothetical protein
LDIINMPANPPGIIPEVIVPASIMPTGTVGVVPAPVMGTMAAGVAGEQAAMINATTTNKPPRPAIFDKLDCFIFFLHFRFFQAFQCSFLSSDGFRYSTILYERSYLRP